MTTEERKKKAEFHHQFVELLTIEEDDEAFYKRLLWGLEIITNELVRFK